MEIFNIQNKSILIVEDDNYNATFLNEILAENKAITTIVQYGKEAVKLINSQHFDLVLMDIGLPDISGYEATKQILASNPQVKIIAQTAYASQDDRMKALAVGCVDYISKPIKPQALLLLLNKYC